MLAILQPFGYTGRSRSIINGNLIQLSGEAVNLDTHRGENWPSRGYTVHREVGDSHSKACASWLHVHSDGGQTPVYWYDTALYPETGSGNPSSIASGLVTSFKPVFVNQAFPSGMSVFFNGTNSESKLIQEISAALDARTYSFAAPTGITATPATTGGSLADGTYHVMVTMEDDAGSVSVETYPQIFTSKVISGGSGNGSIAVNIASATYDARAVNYKIYVSSGSTAASEHFLEATTAKGTTSTTITTLAGTSTITHINETIRQAHLPLDSIDSACFHKGRLCIGSSVSNKVYFSERDNPNHWYSINEVIEGTETSLSGGVVGMISAFDTLFVFTQGATFRVSGEFTRDDQGTSPSYILDARVNVHDASRGLVGPNAVTNVNGVPFFMSDQGLAYIKQGGSELIAPNDAQGMLDCLDQTYRDRWVVCEDQFGYINILVTRLVNSTRPMDGASVAGIADRILRFDTRNGTWACPLAMGDITHIGYRTNESAGSVGGEPRLMASNYTGRILKMHTGWSGAVLDVSGTAYDGQASTAEATTTVSYVESGITADDYNGYVVTLKYPDDDTNYPGVTVQKTIVDTGVSGSTVTLTWVGALTVPSGSGTWTVRVTGLLRPHDVAFDAAALPQVPPGSQIRIKSIKVILQPVIGVESDG